MPTETDPGFDLSFGDFVIARSDERLIGPGGPVRLGRKAYQVLLMLAENDGRLVTKDALFDSVWEGVIVSESALTSVIKELRRALDDQLGQARYIESVYGRGYRFLHPVERSAPGALRSRAPAPVEARSDAGQTGAPPLLAVPPFDDLAVSAQEPHLGAVLREELLGALSPFRDLRLVPGGESGLDGAPRFGERDYQLNVGLVPDGDRVRALCRISRLTTGEIIWADKIALAAGNPLDSVEALARRVAGVALPRLQDDVMRHLPPREGDAFDRYYRLRLRMRGLETIAQAREVAADWELLIASHPDLVQAYPQLVRLYHTDYGFTGLGSTTVEERKRAYRLIHHALALDPTDSHLQTVTGWCHLWAGESALASGHFEQAAQLNPYHQARLVELATGFMFLGELDRAEQLLAQCRKLAEFTTEAPNEEEGLLYLLREDYPRALAALALARRTHPDDPTTARPSIMTELYRMLAAVGAAADDAAEQARGWRAAVSARWDAPDAPDDARLLAWVAFHHPFHSEERRAWLLALTGRALAATDPAASRTPAPARRETPSARPRVAS